MRTSSLRVSIKAFPTASSETRKRGFLFRSDCRASKQLTEKGTKGMDMQDNCLSDTSSNSSGKTFMRVYVLSAPSHQGKSTTLNKLADFLNKQTGWRQTYGPNPPLQGGADSQYAFERQDGLKVGISTAGDGARQIIDGFKYFVQNKSGVCFIASKSWGASIRQIEEECANLSVVPQYQYLSCEYNKRTRNQVQADIVHQLYKMI